MILGGIFVSVTTDWNEAAKEMRKVLKKADVS